MKENIYKSYRLEPMYGDGDLQKATGDEQCVVLQLRSSEIDTVYIPGKGESKWKANERRFPESQLLAIFRNSSMPVVPEDRELMRSALLKIQERKGGIKQSSSLQRSVVTLDV